MGGSIVVERAEQSLGLRFLNPALLEQALVHRSYLNEVTSFPLGSNERLEYLGDAVLELVASEFLFHRFPSATEGELTAMRAAIVRAPTLGKFAREVHLGDLLYLSRGESETGARTRPRLLSQAFEAVIGALYLDQGLSTARDFIFRFIGPEVDRLEAQHHLLDAKSRLQEVVQSDIGVTPEYHLVSMTGPGHRPLFSVEVRAGERVLGAGRAHNKREAEQLAAADALANWPKRPH